MGKSAQGGRRSDRARHRYKGRRRRPAARRTDLLSSWRKTVSADVAAALGNKDRVAGALEHSREQWHKLIHFTRHAVGNIVEQAPTIAQQVLLALHEWERGQERLSKSGLSTRTYPTDRAMRLAIFILEAARLHRDSRGSSVLSERVGVLCVRLRVDEACVVGRSASAIDPHRNAKVLLTAASVGGGDSDTSSTLSSTHLTVRRERWRKRDAEPDLSRLPTHVRALEPHDGSVVLDQRRADVSGDRRTPFWQLAAGMLLRHRSHRRYRGTFARHPTVRLAKALHKTRDSTWAHHMSVQGCGILIPMENSSTLRVAVSTPLVTRKDVVEDGRLFVNVGKDRVPFHAFASCVTVSVARINGWEHAVRDPAAFGRAMDELDGVSIKAFAAQMKATTAEDAACLSAEDVWGDATVVGDCDKRRREESWLESGRSD